MRESTETPIRADCCTSATSVCCFVSLLEASTSWYSPSSAMTPTRIASRASMRVRPRCARNRAGCRKRDAGVVSGFRPQAFASRMAAERVKTRAGLPGPLESLGCRSQRDRPSRKSRGAVCGVAAPPRCAPASPSSRLLASGPAALATPPTPFFGLLAIGKPQVEGLRRLPQSGEGPPCGAHGDGHEFHGVARGRGDRGRHPYEGRPSHRDRKRPKLL